VQKNGTQKPYVKGLLRADFLLLFIKVLQTGKNL